MVDGLFRRNDAVSDAFLEVFTGVLGDLGTFRATIKSEGALNRTDFMAKNIRRVNVRFLASPNMRHKLSVLNPDMQFMKAGDVYSHLGPVEEEQ